MALLVQENGLGLFRVRSWRGTERGEEMEGGGQYFTKDEENWSSTVISIEVNFPHEIWKPTEFFGVLFCLGGVRTGVDTGLLCVVQVVLELRACFCLLSAGIKGLCHPARLHSEFL